jgi:inhibitor of cysteine peptidase
MSFLSIARVIALVAAALMYSPGAVSCPDPEKVSKTMLLTETDNDRTVDMHPGDTLRINLPENATTGYRWAIDHYDEDFIEALASEPRYTAKAIGSGGEVTFVFRVKQTGLGEIVLKHGRHWEVDSSVTRRFRIRLHVRP